MNEHAAAKATITIKMIASVISISLIGYSLSRS